jgi:hypothetical protein
MVYQTAVFKPGSERVTTWEAENDPPAGEMAGAIEAVAEHFGATTLPDCSGGFDCFCWFEMYPPLLAKSGPQM